MNSIGQHELQTTNALGKANQYSRAKIVQILPSLEPRKCRQDLKGGETIEADEDDREVEYNRRVFPVGKAGSRKESGARRLD